MEEKNSNGLAIGALVCGIVSMVLAWFGYIAIVAIALSIVGIVLAVLARKKGASGMATAGLILSIIALALSVIVFVSCVICVAAVKNAVDTGTYSNLLS